TGNRKPWPYFIIETKRLHVTFPSGWHSLVPEYVTGHQGMMCFIDQRYSRSLTTGGMLGFVFDGEIEKARDSVSASIAANSAKLKGAEPFWLSVSEIVTGRPPISESSHTLPHGLFTIYHLFVAV